MVAFSRIALLLLTTIASVGPLAAQATFKIAQIYSNLDGSTQFIRLTETQGLNGQHHFAGLTLTSSHNGITKQFTFPTDLWTDQTANLSIVVASTPSLSLSVFPAAGGNYGREFRPDFDIAPRFLPTDGGSVNFAGLDEIRYAALPTDGTNGLDHDLVVTRAIVSPYFCFPMAGCGPAAIYPPPVFVIEYYRAAVDHYFYTASAPDIDALDSGRLTGWQRTGQQFSESGSQPVCRYYIPPPADSHFFSASREECQDVRARFPAFLLETEAAFFAELPDPITGTCGSPWDYAWITPVYRLWNHRTDTNHRYTTDKGVRDAMIAQGYVAEGYGPDAVAFCE